MAAIFDLSFSNSGTAGTELWVDLGAIPSGFKWWFGMMKSTSPDKSLTFELRTNTATKSTGTLANTLLLFSVSVTPKSGTVTSDLYKNGRLHTATVLSTGVERAWLRLKSKSGTLGSWISQISYTTE